MIFWTSLWWFWSRSDIVRLFRRDCCCLKLQYRLNTVLLSAVFNKNLIEILSSKRNLQWFKYLTNSCYQNNIAKLFFLSFAAFSSLSNFPTECFVGYDICALKQKDSTLIHWNVTFVWGYLNKFFGTSGDKNVCPSVSTSERLSQAILFTQP